MKSELNKPIKYLSLRKKLVNVVRELVKLCHINCSGPVGFLDTVFCYRWVGFYGSATKYIILGLEWCIVLHPGLLYCAVK